MGADGTVEEASPLRGLPSVERVAADPRLAGFGVRPEFLRNLVRLHIAEARRALLDGERVSVEVLGDRIIQHLTGALLPGDRRVINATGVLIHTNLGRVQVSDATAAAMATAATGAVTLEVDPETGDRGDRQRRVADLLRALTGCEAAYVVNNNAAAMMLTVAALAAGRDAIVSRGEAVEIGGGFRIPDVLRHAGARLLEVGTTNRTYASDYREACSATSGILLKVHPSNFVVTGYTHETTVRELVAIGREPGIPVVEDQGSGLPNRIEVAGASLGRSLSECVADGADIVTASGDKLLGGPQCGLILGRADLIGLVSRQPVARAVRVDKVTLAGLEATLRHYLRGEETTAIPLWRMATTPIEDLRRRGRAIVGSLAGLGDGNVMAVESAATFGGGAVPGQTIPGIAVRVRPVGVEGVDALATKLRLGQPAVWGRVEDGCLLLDLRSVPPGDDEDLSVALAAAVRSSR